MSSFRRFARLGAAGSTITLGAVVAGSLDATGSSGLSVGNVPLPNPRLGVQNNVLAPGLSQTSVAWGNLPLANPDAAAGVTHYGYVTSAGAKTPAPFNGTWRIFWTQQHGDNITWELTRTR